MYAKGELEESKLKVFFGDYLTLPLLDEIGKMSSVLPRMSAQGAPKVRRALEMMKEYLHLIWAQVRDSRFAAMCLCKPVVPPKARLMLPLHLVLGMQVWKHVPDASPGVKEVFAEWEEGSGTRSLSSPDVPIHSQHGSGGANAPAAAARGRGAKKGRRRKRQTGKEDL